MILYELSGLALLVISFKFGVSAGVTSALRAFPSGNVQIGFPTDLLNPPGSPRRSPRN